MSKGTASVRLTASRRTYADQGSGNCLANSPSGTDFADGVCIIFEAGHARKKARIWVRLRHPKPRPNRGSRSSASCLMRASPYSARSSLPVQIPRSGVRSPNRSRSSTHSHSERKRPGQPVAALQCRYGFRRNVGYPCRLLRLRPVERRKGNAGKLARRDPALGPQYFGIKLMSKVAN